MNNKRKRIIRYRQKKLYERFVCSFMLNVLIILATILIVLTAGASGNNQNEGKCENQSTVYEFENNNHNTVTLPANTQSEITNTSETIEKEQTISEYTEFVYSKDWSGEDSYLLAKIAMAEAEGCSLECKMHIIMCVLNRVHDPYFPNTIKEVIFQKHNDVYQFTPIGNGRWDRVEPSDECYEALEAVMLMKHNISEGAKYFESCSNKDNWHSRNLEFLYEIDGMRFYR